MRVSTQEAKILAFLALADLLTELVPRGGGHQWPLIVLLSRLGCPVKFGQRFHNGLLPQMGLSWRSWHLGAPTVTVRAISFCQFLHSPVLVAPWNLGSACTLARFITPWSLGGLLAAGLGWGWSPGSLCWGQGPSLVASHRCRGPCSVACWELTPFVGLWFLTRVTVFDVLGDPSA
jgi:hypothetical protein